VRHFFPRLPHWLESLPDPRDPLKIVYSQKTLLWGGLMMFLAHLGSRRQFNYEGRDSAGWMANLATLAGNDLTTVPHGDTIAYYLERLPAEHLAPLPYRMVNRLIRMKALDRFRLFGHLLVALDGTGHLTYSARHCPHCLTQTHEGKTLYYHPVLEAKIVTPPGLALSVATEFIENASEAPSRQDCELKAFYRLAARLKACFPQARLCLLLDALYARAPVLRLCAQNHWRYIITLKAGALPCVFDEFERLKPLEPTQQRVWAKDGKRQTFRWINAIPHADGFLNVLECLEQNGDKTTRFVWVTNFPLTKDTVVPIANKGGRQRWKIENQAFKAQKRDGMDMEHAYSDHPQASKNYYLLLQMAHMLIQLLCHGLLKKTFTKTWGSFRNFVRRFAEAFRLSAIPDEGPIGTPGRPFQIRLDSS
jgi:hypothetical protein